MNDILLYKHTKTSYSFEHVRNQSLFTINVFRNRKRDFCLSPINTYLINAESIPNILTKHSANGKFSCYQASQSPSVKILSCDEVFQCSIISW